MLGIRFRTGPLCAFILVCAGLAAALRPSLPAANVHLNEVFMRGVGRSGVRAEGVGEEPVSVLLRSDRGNVEEVLMGLGVRAVIHGYFPHDSWLVSTRQSHLAAVRARFSYTPWSAVYKISSQVSATLFVGAESTLHADPLRGQVEFNVSAVRSQGLLVKAVLCTELGIECLSDSIAGDILGGFGDPGAARAVTSVEVSSVGTTLRVKFERSAGNAEAVLHSIAADARVLWIELDLEYRTMNLFGRQVIMVWRLRELS